MTSPSTRAEHPDPTELTRCVLADNPSGMTLSGTNTYLLSAPGNTEAILVDPGPGAQAERHWLDVVQALDGRRVTLILITHHHEDHTGAVDLFQERTGAPVRAAHPAWCRGAGPLQDGEVLRHAGVRVQVLATAGHTSDSLCFVLPDDGPAGSVLTGDTILGSGTTMLDHPDGTLKDYLASLDRLEALGPARVLPAHGPSLDSVEQVARQYREHRRQRLDQVRALLQARPAGERDTVSAQELAAEVYPGLEGTVQRVAVQTLAAHLCHLREAGVADAAGERGAAGE